MLLKFRGIVDVSIKVELECIGTVGDVLETVFNVALELREVVLVRQTKEFKSSLKSK